MTTHELARILLSAPEASAQAFKEDHGQLFRLDLTAYVAAEDDLDYTGLGEYGVSPGQAVIDVVDTEEQ